MSKKYVGITIGPIFETMAFTSTPAGLWYASYFYSCLTKNICEHLKANFDIYTIADKKIEQDGVGRYHDRIYCSLKWEDSEENIIGLVKKAIDDSIFDNAEVLSKALNKDTVEILPTLKNFLQIHYVLKSFSDEDKMATVMADYLDAMELSENVEFDVSQNPFKELFKANKKNHNEYLKKIDDIFRLKNLTDGNRNIKDLSSIAKAQYEHEEKKLNNYIAIVRADGDNMGKVITSTVHKLNLEKQEQRIKIFSNLCFSYIDNSINLVNDYGGVMIYGGGDDLLFLAPVIGNKGKTIFELCKDISDEFKTVFNKENEESKYDLDGEKLSIIDSVVPSLSFGVSINYIKFPLYESVNDANNLLFGDSKSGIKNNITCNVHKHSGQSAKFTCNISSDTYKGFIELVRLFINDASGSDDKAIRSFIYHIESFRQIFKQYFKADSSINGKALIDNLFDSDLRDEGRKVKDIIVELMKGIKTTDFNDDDDIEKVLDNKSFTLVSMLRVAKFMCEEEKDG